MSESEFLDERAESVFWAMVDKSDGCWCWAGCISHKGYGRFSVTRNRRSRPYLAHRVAWYFEHGRFPAETIDHLCRNRSCVNPAHMEDVSREENSRRGHGIWNGICKQGHDLSLTDAWTDWHGGNRMCRKCAAKRDRERQDRKPALDYLTTTRS